MAIRGRRFRRETIGQKPRGARAGARLQQAAKIKRPELNRRQERLNVATMLLRRDARCPSVLLVKAASWLAYC